MTRYVDKQPIYEVQTYSATSRSIQYETNHCQNREF